MPKFTIFIDQTIQYMVEVVARNEEHAEEAARLVPMEQWNEYNRLKAEVREDLTVKGG